MPAKRLLLFLTVAVLLLALVCKGGGGPHLPALTPFDPEGLAKVHEIRDLAADVRVIGSCENVTEGTLTREELTAYYEKNNTQLSDKDRKQLETMNEIYRLLHLIGPKDDLLSSVTGMESSQVVGMYSNKENKLVLVTDGEPNLSIDDEVTLAHEYVHCFQYDAFDFKRLGNLGDKEEEKKANTQYSDTIDALMEGDATMSSIFYARDKLGEEGFNNWVNGAGGGSSGNEEGHFPPALERYFNFPYDQGTNFALYLWKKGGWDELNKAYTNPPSTTEQILHPEKYLEGEKAEDLKLPDLSDDLGKDWKQLDDSVFGEFDVYNYLLTILGDEGVASAAAAGWGGGRIALYANKVDTQRVLIHVVLTWDSHNDALEFFQAYLDSLLRIHGPAANPGSLQGEGRPLVWDGEGEHIYTVLDKRAFTLVVATDREDRDAAVAAMSLPSPDSTPTPP